MLLKFGQKFVQNFLMMFLKSQEFRKTLDKKTVHCVLGAREELDQGPEGVFLVHVHEEQGRDLTHPLAVPDLRIIDRISSENME